MSMIDALNYQEKTMNARVLEIFKSLQGEGKYVGAAQVFLRFFECNMHCVWCDTPHSIGDTTKNYQEYSLDQLIQNIKTLWDQCHSLSLTGGEPLLQVDFLKTLLPILRSLRIPVYLETNGTLPGELSQIIDGVDIIAMDIKLPSSTQCRAYWQEHEDFINIAKSKDFFIKTVISSQTSREDVLRAVEMVRRTARDALFILQPNYFDMKNGVMNRCLEYQADCLAQLSNVRIIPQTHKFMKLR